MFHKSYFGWKALIILFSLTLSACGFQFRGEESRFMIPSQWSQLALRTANPRDEFTRQVTLVFQAAGVEWKSISSASYILNLAPSKLTQRAQSLNALARPSEIELTLSSNFSVSKKEGSEVIPEVSMFVRRIINNDSFNAIGVNEEVRLATIEMRRELAKNILRRISSLAHSKNIIL